MDQSNVDFGRSPMKFPNEHIKNEPQEVPPSTSLDTLLATIAQAGGLDTDPAHKKPESKEIAQPVFPENYTVLRGSEQNVEGSKWSTEWLLSEYVSATDGLIGKMDGSIPLKDMTVFTLKDGELVKEERDLQPPEAVIYLDKSARPVEWMVRQLWPVLARTPGTDYAAGEVPQKPDDYFLNIDKRDWLRRMGVPPEHLEDPPEEMVDITKISRDHLARIRAMYVVGPMISEDNLDEVWTRPTRLDGKHVMIVDEVKSSGQTLLIAQKLLSLAIPEATFSGEYWAIPKKIALRGGAPVNGQMQFMREWVPVWYSAETASGRGISDRDPRWPEIAEEHGYPVLNRTRVGRHILSTPPHNPETKAKKRDFKARELRVDMRLMAEDLQNHKILYRPSIDRPRDSDEDFDAIVARIEAVSGLTYDEWRKKRDELMPKPGH